jgi:hypothetical protein
VLGSKKEENWGVKIADPRSRTSTKKQFLASAGNVFVF